MFFSLGSIIMQVMADSLILLKRDSGADDPRARFSELVGTLTAWLHGRVLEPALGGELERIFPPDGAFFCELAAACTAGLDAGWLGARGEPPLRYGRIIKPSPDTHGFSIDVVLMSDIAGPEHVHPNGEVDMVVPIDPAARFEGHGAGWVVFGPGSTHAPTVARRVGGSLICLTRRCGLHSDDAPDVRCYRLTHDRSESSEKGEGEAGYLQIIAGRVRDLRAKRGMTRRVLARDSGVSERYSGAARIRPSKSFDVGDPCGSRVRSTSARPLSLSIPMNRRWRTLSLRRFANSMTISCVRCNDSWRTTFSQRETAKRERRIALIGLRGAGKTTIGTLLAKRLGFPFIELDRRSRTRCRRSVVGDL